MQGWRASCDIQLIIDHHACVEYLAKYASKREKMSTVVRDAFTCVVSKADESSDTKALMRKLMMKAAGERDMGIQEVMHHILSLKLFSSSFNVITLSLDGSRKCKLDNGILIREQSTLDHYAQRTTFSAQLIDLNLVQFVSNYAVVKESLTVRKSPVIVRTVPSYSSYPNGRNYGLICKYQLIKYKPWITKPSNAWNEEDECDLTFTNYWQSFLESERGQKLVPNWQRELQNSQHLSPGLTLILLKTNAVSNVALQKCSRSIAKVKYKDADHLQLLLKFGWLSVHNLISYKMRVFT